MPTVLRRVALLAVGALALHEVRYRVAYGEDAGTALAAQGHGYLALAWPLAAALVVAAAWALAGSLARGAAAEAAPPARPARRRLLRSWLAACGALLAVHAVQELAEGALSSGHPDGLAGLVAHGGPAALVVAVALAGLVAVALLGAEEAVAAARRPRAARAAVAGAASVAIPPAPRPPARRPLALRLASRAPPAAAC